MRAALRVSTKLSSSYDGYYIKFNQHCSVEVVILKMQGAVHLRLNIMHLFIHRKLDSSSQTIFFEPRIARPDMECLVDFSPLQHVNITPFA